MAAGGAVAPLAPGAGVQEAGAQLAQTGARVLVTAPALLHAARAAAAASGCVREIVVLGEAEGATPIAALIADAGPPPERPIRDGDPALLPCSSGTTGLPKPVMLTQRNVVAAARQVRRVLDIGERDTLLALAPFAHVMGFVVTLAAPLIAGASVVTAPRFELETMLALLERHRVTVLVVPPPVAAVLARHPAVAGHDLSALELIVSGGAPLGAEVHAALAARFPHAGVGQGYGLTETAAAVSGPEGRAGGAPGTVGRLVPDTELRVVDPATGRDLGPGEPGELWVRGPQVMAGYLHHPDATAAVLDPAGWLRTGDLGRVEPDETIVIVDRLKELIKVDALPVAPAELEALLLAHPQVADAAVIPRPDARHGEVPVALVVAAGELDADALLAWVADRVAPHKRLRAVRPVPAIPRTPAGKILRRALIASERDLAEATA